MTDATDNAVIIKTATITIAAISPAAYKTQSTLVN